MAVLPRLKDKKQAAFDAFSMKRRRLVDQLARVVITFGGVGIILSIIAILVFISLEVYPLWKGAKAELSGRFDLNKSLGVLSHPVGSASVSDFPILALGIDEYRQIGFVITKSGLVDFMSLKDGNKIKQIPLRKIEGKTITAALGSLDNRKYTLGTDDGYILPVGISFKVSFSNNQERISEPEVVEGEPIKIDSQPLTQVAYNTLDDGTKGIAAVTSEGRLFFVSEVITSSLVGEEKREVSKYDLTPELKGSIVTAIALDNFLDNLYVGTNKGELFLWDIRDKANPKLAEVIDATRSSETAITVLGFLLGERSLIVGDGNGNVSTWFEVEDKTSPIGRRLKKVHPLTSHNGVVTDVAASPRDRGLLSADSKGVIILDYSTSERKLVEFKGEGHPIKVLAFAPKADGAVAIDERGTLYNWKIENPHPEISLKALFGKVWYEGYSKPEYVWQSTGGTDDFEPKLSLTPLAYGTLKGTAYALIFAIPLAILGALCVSQFMHPSIRNAIKPVIEIMAALPSVVLGFLAGLWMAPLIEKIVPAVFLMPVVLTIMTISSVFIWRLLPKSVRGRFKDGTELLLLIPVFILGIQVCLWLNLPAENLFFGGDFKAALFKSLGLQYDQRNALIVGFAMGFAVIPIIFTISEDALANVPRHLISGSLALGATRWQTAINVVLPTASAGIFSAIMIGFGRAVGETMIVLMATGNTPIMDWSIFNGFRALSANIAVEIPEAPHGGTLYRVLFLAALLLFLVTFLVNTAAEIVRMKLRKKYQQI
jgi:phosphate transport system permease protein